MTYLQENIFLIWYLWHNDVNDKRIPSQKHFIVVRSMVSLFIVYVYSGHGGWDDYSQKTQNQINHNKIL